MDKELMKAQSTSENGIIQSEAQQSKKDFATVMESGNIEALLAGVENIKTGKALDLNIAMTYLDVEQGKNYRMRFCGFIEEKYPEIPEPLKCAVLVDENRNLYKYGAKLFVSALERANFVTGSDIEFAWTGQKKTQSGGNIRIHSIKPILKDEDSN
jgi:hypothetical protein